MNAETVTRRDPILDQWVRHWDHPTEIYGHINTAESGDPPTYWVQTYDARGPVEQAFDQITTGDLEDLTYYLTQADCLDRRGGKTLAEVLTATR